MTHSPLDFSIRRMVPEDLAEVYALDQASFSSPWSLKGFRQELTDNPRARLWVVEKQVGETGQAHREIRIIGMLVAWLVIDEIHIGTIAVHPAFRRKGVAARLLATAFEELAAEGAVCSSLEVRASNIAAQELYHQFGFYEVNRRRGYYQDNGEDAILMNLDDLSQALAAMR